MDEEEEIADELEFLQWFYSNVDFGPAHEDVMIILLERFYQDTHKTPPLEYLYD